MPQNECHDNVSYLRERNEPIKRADDTIHGKGPRGPGDGGGMDNLEKRVTNLESDVKVIREDLTTLTVRSENFSTKSDLVELKSALHTELRNQTWAFCGLLVAAIAAVAGIVALMR